jgi:hypothetical protein
MRRRRPNMKASDRFRTEKSQWRAVLIVLSVMSLSMLPLGMLTGCEAAKERPSDLGLLTLNSPQGMPTRHYLIVDGIVMTSTVKCDLREGHLYFNNISAQSQPARPSIDEQRELRADTYALKVPYVAKLVRQGTPPRAARSAFNQRIIEQLNSVRDALAQARLKGGDRVAAARLQLDQELVDTTIGQKHSPQFRSDCDGFTLFFHGQGWIGLDCPSNDGTAELSEQPQVMTDASARAKVKLLQDYFRGAHTAVVIIDAGGDIYVRDNVHATELADEIESLLSGRRAPSAANQNVMRLPRHIAQKMAARKEGAKAR